MSRRAHPSRTGANPAQNRVTDNDTPILSTGDEFQHDFGDFSVQLQETLDHGMSIRTRKDLRCRLQRIAKFWKAHCPVYFNKGVRKNTPAEMNDPSLYFYNHIFLIRKYVKLNLSHANFLPTFNDDHDR